MEIIDCIFCDDIRFELHNKLSLMGVYSERLVFNVMETALIACPINTKISLLLRLQMKEKETRPDRFKFTYFLNQQSLTTLEGAMQVDTTSSLINLVLLVPTLQLDVGHLGFTVQLFEKDKQLWRHEDMSALKIEINHGEKPLQKQRV